MDPTTLIMLLLPNWKPDAVVFKRLRLEYVPAMAVAPLAVTVPKTVREEEADCVPRLIPTLFSFVFTIRAKLEPIVVVDEMYVVVATVRP